MFGYAAVLAYAMATVGRSAAAPALGVLMAVSYPASVPYEGSIVTHERDNRFLQLVLLKDRLWKPVLSHRVKLTAKPREPTDRFAPAPVASTNVVDPFREVVLLMAYNSLAGTEVQYAMSAVRKAMLCCALQRVSLQAFMLHHLIAKGAERVARTIVEWLEQTVRVIIDKLAAVDQPAPLVARVHYHVRHLMVVNANLASNELEAIAQQMNNWMSESCVTTPENQCPYARLLQSFKTGTAAIERLDTLDEALSLDEGVKGVMDLNGMRELHELYGSLKNVPENIDLSGLADLSEADLKRLLTLNRIETNFLWSNLPTKSLADSQWSNLFNVKPLSGNSE